MSLQCLTSDFVSRINNAIKAGLPSIDVMKSQLIVNCTKKLTSLGYFASYEENEKTVTIVLNLNKLNKVNRVSTPGKRVYTSYVRFPRIENGKGWNILTTSKGIKTNFEAKQEKIGGELLFQVF